MRQIEKHMVEAINAGRNWKESNTRVICRPLSWSNLDGCKPGEAARVFLHGNLICIVYNDGRRAYSSTGWNTPTTRSRLQALGCDCRIKAGRLVDYWTGAPIYDGRL
jgi:hypothetical protein